MIQEAAHPDANIIWGTVLNESLDDEMVITVIATGFDSSSEYELPQYNFKSPASDPQGQAAPAEQAPAAEAPKAEPEPEEDDQDFFDIMALFNNKK